MFQKTCAQILTKFTQLFSSKNSVNRNAACVGALLFLSRILGLVREIIISRFVDINYLDLYTISDKIPSIIRRLSGEGILEYAYIPPLSEFDKEKESKESSAWITSICGMFTTVVLLMVYVAIITSSLWAPKLLSSYKDPRTLSIFMDFFAMQVPMVVFYFLSSTFIVILLRYEIFNHSHFGQPIANIFKIATLLIGYKISDSYFVVGLQALAGAVTHIIWQYYGTRKISREKYKNKLFPDRFASTLVWIIGSFIITGIFYYICEYSKLKGFFQVFRRADGNLFPPGFMNFIYGNVIGLSILFAITIFFMRKKDGDGTLNYGSTGLNRSMNTLDRINFYSYISLISLDIIQKVSVFIPYLYWLNLASSVFVGMFVISGILAPKKRKSYIFMNLPITIITISIGVLSFFNPWFRHILIIASMSSNAIKMYLDNFKSENLTDKIKKINLNFLKNFTNSMFGVGINQIISLIGIAVAAKLGHGAPSYIARTDRLMQVPINLIAVPFGLALLPRLSSLIAQNKDQEAQEIYNESIMLNVGLSIVTIGLAVLLSQPLANLFLGGKTSRADVEMICYLFKLELFGLPAWVLSKVLASVYFATQKSNVLFKAALVQCLVNVPLKILIWKMGFGVKAFPIASIAGAWANTLFLLCNAKTSIDLFGPIRYIFQSKKNGE